MAQFGGMELTNAGRNILAKALLGKTLKFTRAWAGDGYLPEGQDVREMTQIVKPHREMEIAEMSIPPHIGMAKITVILTNKELTTGFFFREIGLFAADPDTGDEFLYGYCNSGDTADFMPGQDGPDTVYYRFDLTVIVDQAKNVTAIFYVDDDGDLSQDDKQRVSLYSVLSSPVASRSDTQEMLDEVFSGKG